MQELIKKLERQYGKPISEFTEFDWSRTSRYQKLSEEFIREYQNDVNWEYISKNQKLSEDFIREFQDKVDWEWISNSQNLSEKFIRKINNNWKTKKKWYQFWK